LPREAGGCPLARGVGAAASGERAGFFFFTRGAGGAFFRAAWMRYRYLIPPPRH
jgi:hypothetical protein